MQQYTSLNQVLASPTCYTVPNHCTINTLEGSPSPHRQFTQNLVIGSSTCYTKSSLCNNTFN
uniref:Uncharacterized protein n=1 Tax=Arion vulgaris TaxID=1028688 RepID=A0A0B7ACV8_9EUPU